MATKKTSSSSANQNKGRNVVVCCDGTGIGEDNSQGEFVTPSNVVRIFNCIDTASEAGERDQIGYYERGVGSVGNILTKYGQGLTGHGIGTKIQILYQWLATNWKDYPKGADGSQEEDHLYLFGFSRGAFAVKSLQGMIHRVGLLDLNGLDSREQYRRARAAYYQGYQQEKAKEEWACDKNGPWKFHGDEEFGRIPIHFLGAFDTVGQLGFPRESWLLWTCGFMCCFFPNSGAFHYVSPSPDVRTARDAVAMDEMRSTFQPVFSRGNAVGYVKSEAFDTRQVWFPGGHADIGGGNLDHRLSDGALKWMVDEAALKGLRFQPNMIAQIRPDFQGNIFLKHGTVLYKNLTYYPRSVPAVTMDNCEDKIPDQVESVHISAVQRSQNPRISQAPYFNTQYLQVGEQVETFVRADQVYNSTFVYMEAGATYKIKSEGMWAGFRGYPCGPDGYSTMAFVARPFYAMRIGVGMLQSGCRSCSGNREVRLPLLISTRRHETFPWFSVVGMIASGGTRNVVGEADFHTVFGIGKEVEYEVTGKQGGYLYCYANDLWNDYIKNRGAMVMTIERLK